MHPAPAYDDVIALPARLETVVWREHIDANGHMNTRHHFEFNSQAIDAAVRAAGVDQRYRDTHRMGLFTAEQRLRYHAELVEGSRLSVHVRVLDRGARAVHLMSFLVDRDQRRVANTLEVVAVHVDLTTRRAVSMRPEVAAGFDRLLADSRSLPWEPSTGGALGLRSVVTAS